mgnify:CR=1 FL=1
MILWTQLQHIWMMKKKQVHFELAPCSQEEFLKRYLELDPDFAKLLYNEFGIEI